MEQYTPELDKRLRWFYRPLSGEGWKLDETYVKVKGKWKYLYRAITERGETLDFYLSATRNARADRVFLGKILRKMKNFEKPDKINTDKAPCYSHVIGELKREGPLNNQVVHRKIKYLNNRIESN